jgi:hypothetical protein
MLTCKRKRGFTILLIMLLATLILIVPRYALVHTPSSGVDEEARKTIRVIDASTQRPIAGAFVTSGNNGVCTNEDGMCTVRIEGSKVAVRAPGYSRTEERITTPQEEKPEPFTAEAFYLALREKVTERNDQATEAPWEIRLVPFDPRALYLSFYGVGDKTLRESALKLIQETELNALVIDVKGDRAMIPYKSSVSLASEVGAQKIITVRDMAGLMRSFKENGVYTIARIVVFKDNLLAQKMPHLAVKAQNGKLWRDREDLAWVDPFKREVWDYTIDIAIEAAQHGFDEIQFDYVRFPDSSSPQFSMPNTQENRLQAISGFLVEARRRLLPYNVFLSADIFGYVCWNLNDTNIGQSLEGVLPHVDYLCPMLYPSGFQYGIPGYKIPTKHPYEIVYLTLKRAKERTNLPSVRFRPWLQAFKDYAFDKRSFEDKEIRDQISAVEKFGSRGWMLWNPRNYYSKNGLKRESLPKLALQKE